MIQIKVIKTTVFDEIQPYIASKLKRCPVFQEGQVFVTEYEKPQGFCDWAWNDIHDYISVLMTGGTFSEGLFSEWMKNKNSMIACCTDGARPVVFEIKKIEK